MGKQVKSVALPFQVKGAEALFNILKDNSRAFLADEAGLGKTFTATILMKKLAEEHFDKVKDNIFFVLYVGPNVALLNKCCHDIIKKYNGMKKPNDPDILYLGDKPTYEYIMEQTLIYYYRMKKKPLTLAQLNNYLTKFKELYNTYLERSKGTVPKRSIVKKAVIDSWDSVSENWVKGETFYNYYKSALDNPENKITYDRLILAKNKIEKLISKSANTNKKIVLLSTSIGLMGDTDIIKKDEKAILKDMKRSDVEKELLQRFGLVIFDEYHRYFKKVDPYDLSFRLKSVYDNEENSNLKLLFISATPYRANKSHIEEESFEEDTGNINVLPTFEDFAKLFCEGLPRLSKDSLIELDKRYKKASEEYINASEEEKINFYGKVKNYKDLLQDYLRKRMVRHERTMLSKNRLPEKHTELFKINLDDDFVDNYKDPVRNMYKQYHLLKTGGYDNGALNWSLSMPWLLTFSTKYKTPEYFDYLNPEDKKVHPDLFLYDNNGKPKDGLLSQLPKSNVAFYQICKSNLDIMKGHNQLIWMPPTMPEYRVENGIFAVNASHSKLIIFAEYRYLQRGGALLLSEYARLSNKSKKILEDVHYIQAKSAVEKGFSFKLNQQFIRIMEEYYSKPNVNDNPWDETLDSKIKRIEEWLTIKYSISNSKKTALAILASPLACAYRMGLDNGRIEDGFNKYFKKPYITEALTGWLIENKESFINNDGDYDFELGLLEYCAEGNLYSVLKEWQACAQGEFDEDYIAKILSDDSISGRVHVQTYGTYTSHGKENGIEKMCGFAAQLTPDLHDVGRASGDTAEEEEEQLRDAFNSPFYPMILFVGRGAQEGLDFHNYCQRIMHLTLPRGAVSFDQRQGRIDRYRSLLVRKRIVELAKVKYIDFNWDWDELFNNALRRKEDDDVPAVWKDDQLFPFWQIKEHNDYKSIHHFERIVPILPYTQEYLDYQMVLDQLNSYRATIGSTELKLPPGLLIDLTA